MSVHLRLKSHLVAVGGVLFYYDELGQCSKTPLSSSNWKSSVNMEPRAWAHALTSADIENAGTDNINNGSVLSVCFYVFSDENEFYMCGTEAAQNVFASMMMIMMIKN